jgi:hypothetical protein
VGSPDGNTVPFAMGATCSISCEPWCMSALLPAWLPSGVVAAVLGDVMVTHTTRVQQGSGRRTAAATATARAPRRSTATPTRTRSPTAARSGTRGAAPTRPTAAAAARRRQRTRCSCRASRAPWRLRPLATSASPAAAQSVRRPQPRRWVGFQLKKGHQDSLCGRQPAYCWCTKAH